MPFSFTQIEKEKTATIQLSLVFLLSFYFLSALALVYAAKAFFYFSSLTSVDIAGGVSWPLLDLPTAGWTLLGAVAAGAVHWQYSQYALIDGVLQMMGGRLADEQASDEKMFRNVVEEASVATGGKYRIEPYIIPTAAMNAFALQDAQGRCVIGITEGLLMRLNREQLEGVVGHEAGHIASGDCRETTTISALFKTFDNICDITLRLVMSSGRVGMVGAAYAGSRERRSNDGRLVLFFLMLFILASLLRFIGYLGAMFISRQREYRADALSAKLTRNPMALAEALHIISTRWKGAGMPGQNMEAIFIANPRRNSLEEASNLFADIFTTHPPAEKRIAILLDMAHGSEKDLDAALAQAKTRFEAFYAPPAQAEARCDPRLGPGLMAAASAVVTAKDSCPRCHVPLSPEMYEGVSVFFCTACGGALVRELDVLHIVHTREQTFDPRIGAQAELIRRQARPLRQNPFDGIYDEKSIVCPSCLGDAPRMQRRFVNPKFPVEVDKCRACGRVWFDKDELEVLQYLYELEHPLQA